MMRSFLLALLAAAAWSPAVLAAEDLPPVEAFQVFEQSLPPGPRITPYLQYQAEQAWKQGIFVVASAGNAAGGMGSHPG